MNKEDFLKSIDARNFKSEQSVSKSFAESLKPKEYSNNDRKPSKRSGYRYAQIDTYNRKKGQSR